jgi:rod shape-determining protein MreD
VKIAALIIFSYAIFLAQVMLGRWAPELAAIVIIAAAWFEPRYLSLVLGFFFGLLYGILNPNLLGLDIIIYTSLGFLVGSIKNYIYHYRLLILSAAVVVIIIRNLFVWGAKFPLVGVFVSMGITIVIALPFWAFMKKVFRWKTG